MAEYVYQRPKLYKLQSEAFFNDIRYAWIEGSTKSGKTVSCMAWIIEQAVFLGKEGREFWWVAPVSAVASIAFKRLKRGIHSSYTVSKTLDLLSGLKKTGCVPARPICRSPLRGIFATHGRQAQSLVFKPFFSRY